jgi:uncharacterized delta-60 repeat protein
VVTDFDHGNDAQWAVAVQHDGKILTGGRSGPDTSFHTTLTRYNVDGLLDQSFGNNGRAVVQVATTDEIHSIALEPNGKILVAGHAGSWPGRDFSVLRFLPDGQLDDLTFGTHGVVMVQFDTGFDAGRAIALDTNGDIVVAGMAGGLVGVARLHELLRYSVAGRIFDSFGRPIRQAIVTITDSSGVEQTTSSSSFGYFSFADVTSGKTTITVASRGHSFAPITLGVQSNIDDLDVFADPPAQLLQRKSVMVH